MVEAEAQGPYIQAKKEEEEEAEGTQAQSRPGETGLAPSPGRGVKIKEAEVTRGASRRETARGLRGSTLRLR